MVSSSPGFPLAWGICRRSAHGANGAPSQPLLYALVVKLVAAPQNDHPLLSTFADQRALADDTSLAAFLRGKGAAADRSEAAQLPLFEAILS
jgi:hypothetical protein